jgi:uncharacterized protein (DUF1778 family)
MSKPDTRRRPKKAPASTTLIVRLDLESKEFLTSAAGLRHVSVSDYVRLVTVAQARKEVLAAHEQTIALTADEQLAFWKALDEPTQLTPAQRRLSSLMRGES